MVFPDSVGISVVCVLDVTQKETKRVCCVQSFAVVEIPVCNGGGEPLMLEVLLEGDGLTGDGGLCVPALETLTYKVTFCPVRAGRSTGR